MSESDLDKEPTETLIECIKWRDQEGYLEIAQNAFRAFFFRFNQDIIKKCRIISKNWGYDKHVGDLIAERTFDRFYKYNGYDHSKSNAKDVDTGVTFYLYRIAQHLLADYRLQESGENINPFSGNEEIVREFPNLEKRKDLRGKYEIIEKALERLSAKHRIIYLTYKAHEKDGYNLPRKLLQSLRDELDLTQASIRVYKKEAFDKVDEYLKIYGAK